jgi:dTDP-4-dehydrorhamnose reductase
MRDLAAACREFEVRLLTFSSDYVFGGDRQRPYEEHDAPRPLQIYGISRLAGEYAVLATAPQHAIVVRTCGLYGRSGALSKGGNFVDGRVADIMAGKRIEMASEQIVSPTSTDDLSKAVFQLVTHAQAKPGIYHLANSGCCSWFEFTVEILRWLNGASEVIPVDRGGITGGMRRPVYSVLANKKAAALGICMRPWKSALSDYLQEKYSGKR